MEGYDVTTSDECKFGHICGERGDFLIVEHGTLFKTRHALPRVFAQVDDERRVVRATVSKALLETSPKFDDKVDERAVAAHYGLAAGSTRPDTEGYGAMNSDDPAWSSEQQAQRDGVLTAEQERLHVQQSESAHPGSGPPDEPRDDLPTHRPIPYI